MKKRNTTQPGHYSEYRKLLGLGKKDPLPKLALLANAEDELTGDGSEIYAFIKPAGRFGTERVPRDRAFQTSSLSQTIIAKNGLLPRDQPEATRVVEKAANVPPREHWLFLKADGWQSDFTAFSHRGEVFGNARADGLILKAPLANAKRTYPLLQSGTLRGWQQITQMAHRSSRLRLALCTAFAAPLLKIVDLQSFTIVLAGRSKAGKSTALLAASSVIGIGYENGLPNFNATPAALQEAAVEFTDRVLPVNEIALIKGPRREAYHALRPLTYRYSEGRDTARHSKSPYGREGEALNWRGIMLVSSENTFDALAELAGEKRDEGEYARAFDVPAMRPGQSTIFDHFPRHLQPTEREAWTRAQLITLRALCRNHHGTAFDVYLKYLLENRSELRQQVEAAMHEFLDACSPLPASGALQHAARNFSILFAGARLAHRAGLLPTWRHDSTLQALKSCLEDGFAEVEHTQTMEERACRKLKQRLRQIETLPPAATRDDIDVGWLMEKPDGQRVFAIRSKPFQSWFESEAEARAAIRWLFEKNLLKMVDGATPAFPNIEWATTFPKIKGDGLRCFQFRDPETAR